MSTTTLDRKSIRNSAGPGPAFHRVLNSEFIKFRTLTSTLILLSTTTIVIVGIAVIMAQATGSIFANTTNPDAATLNAAQSGDYAVGVPTTGVTMAILILGSLGALLMSSEFSTGMARSTFTAVPKRSQPFLAKLGVLMVSGFILTAASAYIAGLLSTPILNGHNIEMDLGSPASIKHLLVNSLYVAAVAAIGVALGALLRNPAGAIMSLVALFFIAPITISLIPGEFFDSLNNYLPSNTINPMTAPEHLPGTLEAWQAALVLGAWTILPVALAIILLKKRDI